MWATQKPPDDGTDKNTTTKKKKKEGRLKSKLEPFLDDSGSPGSTTQSLGEYQRTKSSRQASGLAAWQNGSANILNMNVLLLVEILAQNLPVGTTDYRYESRKAPMSWFASTNS